MEVFCKEIEAMTEETKAALFALIYEGNQEEGRQGGVQVKVNPNKNII